MTRSREERARMVVRLSEERMNSSKQPSFGDSNDEAYNAAIIAIDRQMTVDGVERMGLSDYARDLAVAAAQWVNCEISDNELIQE